MSRLLEIDLEIYELQSVLRKILVVQNEYEMVLKLGSKWASWKRARERQQNAKKSRNGARAWF